MPSPLIISRVSIGLNGRESLDYFQGRDFGPEQTAKRFDSKTVAGVIQSLRYQHPRDAMRVVKG